MFFYNKEARFPKVTGLFVEDFAVFTFAILIVAPLVSETRITDYY